MQINPILTTNASGSFSKATDGYIAGTYLADPAIRFALAGGILAAGQNPIWGGVGISEAVPAGTSSPQLGGSIIRATSLAAVTTGQEAVGRLTGFSVFDQAHDMINSPQSPVPSASAGQGVKFFRLGSGARVVVPCDPVLINLRTYLIKSLVSWDFINQLLVPYEGTLTISSGTYNDTTGVVVLTMSAPITFTAGDSVVVSSLTGTGAYASLNGTFTAIATTSGSTVTYNAGAGLGASAITGGSLTLGSGSDVALPCNVLDVDAGNSMVPVYDPVTQFVTWNRTGSAAVIQI